MFWRCRTCLKACQQKPTKWPAVDNSSDAGVPCESLCNDARRANHLAQTVVVSTKDLTTVVRQDHWPAKWKGKNDIISDQ
jgi:hypothetical protein